MFNDRFGTGQSTLDGILRATNLLLAGRTRGRARLRLDAAAGWRSARAGAGASVIVCEVDPLRALEARMEGFEVMPALAAAERGDVFVTVTGGRDVLARAHFERMKDGAVAGQRRPLRRRDRPPRPARAGRRRAARVRPLVDRYVIGGRRLNLLAEGRVVNLAAAEGHPAAVMDMSFAVHALVVEHLVRAASALRRGVHPVPDAIDREVARLKLASLGVEIDVLSERQREYLSSWDQA